MGRFATPGHLVSWAKLSPRTIQSGTRSPPGKTGMATPCLKGMLGEAAAAAARTDTFPGERFCRLARRIGGVRAQCAVSRPILAIISPAHRPRSPLPPRGRRLVHQPHRQGRKARSHIRQLDALGFTVTLA
jgi:transposase